MTLDEVNARIATLEQKIAEKKAVENAYNRPASVYDYIIGGDRSGLDRIAQQKMTEELAKKQREDQSKYTQNELANKYQLAMTDYELAEAQKDNQKPETMSRYKRAAQMVNHYGSQLGFEPVKPDFETDAPAIKVNKAIAKVRALMKTTPKKWTNEQKQEYVDTMALIPDEDERKAELEVALTNMPKTTNEKEYDRFLQLKKSVDAGYTLFGKELEDWNNLSKKYK